MGDPGINSFNFTIPSYDSLTTFRANWRYYSIRLFELPYAAIGASLCFLVTYEMLTKSVYHPNLRLLLIQSFLVTGIYSIVCAVDSSMALIHRLWSVGVHDMIIDSWFCRTKSYYKGISIFVSYPLLALFAIERTYATYKADTYELNSNLLPIGLVLVVQVWVPRLFRFGLTSPCFSIKLQWSLVVYRFGGKFYQSAVSDRTPTVFCSYLPLSLDQWNNMVYIVPAAVIIQTGVILAFAYIVYVNRGRRPNIHGAARGDAYLSQRFQVNDNINATSMLACSLIVFPCGSKLCHLWGQPLLFQVRICIASMVTQILGLGAYLAVLREVQQVFDK